MKLIDTLELKDQQPEAATTRGRDISVSAGAGSGKTKTLVARYLSLLDEKHPPRTVVAITFTKKAAREMRNRIRQAIQDWLSGDCPDAERQYWRDLEADIDTARIGTIHGLCEAILRAHPAEARIDPGFGVLDEGLGVALEAQVVEETLNWASQQPDLLILFDAFSTETLRQILSVLLDKRLDASTAFAGRNLVEAWDQVLKSKLADFAAGVSGAIDELNALAARGLDDDAGPKLAEQVRSILPEWKAFRESVSNGSGIAATQHLFSIRRNHCDGRTGKRTSRAKESVRAFREMYDEWLDPWVGGKTKDDSPPDPARESRLGDTIPLLRSLYERAREVYESTKDIRHELDFDDLESKAAELLQIQEIRSRWQVQIDALLVDEFQDTNERQRQIVEALAGTQDGKGGRLFVVGDAKQSIYRFRGANVSVFRDLEQTIRARGGLPLRLDRTFRAHAGLVNALNEILAAAMDSDSRYAVPFTPLQANRERPQDGITEPYVEFLWGLGENADTARASAAMLLAERLKKLRGEEGVRWDQIALLFRASTGFPAYEEALEAADIPFVTVAGRGFYDRPEIRDLLNILRALADPWNDLAMTGLLRSPAFGLSDEALYLLRWSNGEPKPVNYWTALSGEMLNVPDAERVRAKKAHDIVTHLAGIVDRVTVAELLKQALDTTLYPAILSAHIGGARLQRNVEKLLSDAQTSQIVRVNEFLEYLETLHEAGAREGEAPSEAGQAVRLMTIHKAKGLEFPIVVVADASRARPGLKAPVLISPEMRIVPNPDKFDQPPLMFGLAKALEQEQSDAEDLRLLYVAATRAAEKIIFCGHQINNSHVWSNQLADAASFGLAPLVEKQGEWTTAKLTGSGQLVRGMAKEIALAERDEREDKVQEATASDAPPLYVPLVTQAVAEIDQKEVDSADSGRRLRRVVGKRRRPEGTVLGTLVHAALSRWRFPGDAGLEELLRAEALMEGLVDQAELDVTVAQAKELLNRFRTDARFAGVDSATERRHEIPYCLLGDNDLPSMGVIDLVYRNADSKWHIVDFKTDDIQNDAQFSQLIEQYSKQIVRYRKAVRQLLEQSAASWLCFLNYGSNVRWERIP